MFHLLFILSTYYACKVSNHESWICWHCGRDRACKSESKTVIISHFFPWSLAPLSLLSFSVCAISFVWFYLCDSTRFYLCNSACVILLVWFYMCDSTCVILLTNLCDSTRYVRIVVKYGQETRAHCEWVPDYTSLDARIIYYHCQSSSSLIIV